MSIHPQLIRAVRIDYRISLVARRIILMLKARPNETPRRNLKVVSSIARGTCAMYHRQMSSIRIT